MGVEAAIPGASSGAWGRVYGCLRPIFLGFVNQGLLDRMVVFAF